MMGKKNNFFKRNKPIKKKTGGEIIAKKRYQQNVGGWRKIDEISRLEFQLPPIC